MRLYLLSLTLTAILFGFQFGAVADHIPSPNTIILTGGILIILYILAPSK
jgi:hypothetical protein